MKVFLLSLVMDLIGLHTAVTSTQSNTFGMNWNTNWEPGRVAHIDPLFSQGEEAVVAAD